MIIGIDLGTTNSSAAFINQESKAEVIINDRGKRLIPSVVYFQDEKMALVGESAINSGNLSPDNIITNIKRKMGKHYNVDILGRGYTPAEISSLILRKIKNYSEEYLNNQIKKIVLTVPAYFNHVQRAATKRAAELASLELVKMINEPTAAALAYNMYNSHNENILIFDMGGGTLDITLVEYKDKVQRTIATGGDTYLGGIDFDAVIADILMKEFETTYNVNIENDYIAMNQIKIAAKKAKEDLSSLDNTTIVIPYIAMTEKGPLHLRKELTRVEFETAAKNLVEKITKLINDIFVSNEIDFNWVTRIVFVGGATRMPMVRNAVLSFFANRIDRNVVDMLPKSQINPDEAVAIGAAIYAGIIENKITEIEFYDVTSHYFGIEDDDGKFVPIIEKNSVYPLSVSKFFTTVNDYQEFIKVHILQSKDDKGTTELSSLGYFFLDNLPHKKAGELDIEIIFSVNKHGILNVMAMDLEEGNYKEIEIKDFYNNEEMKAEKRGPGIKVL